MKHAPGTWKVVHGSSSLVTAMAMCRCGDDNCAWTATAYESNFVRIASAPVGGPA